MNELDLIQVREICRDNTADAIRILLASFGENIGREGLVETPKRVAKFYHDFFDVDKFTFTTFDAEGNNQMVVASDIAFYSLCEHHLVPFFGVAHVAYIPSQRIVGLSKLPRTVHKFARRLQNQERLTKQIHDFINENLQPQGVGVVLRARHLCQEMRGPRAEGAFTTSSYLSGVFNEGPCRQEFLSLAMSRG